MEIYPGKVISNLNVQKDTPQRFHHAYKFDGSSQIFLLPFKYNKKKRLQAIVISKKPDKRNEYYVVPYDCRDDSTGTIIQQIYKNGISGVLQGNYPWLALWKKMTQNILNIKRPSQPILNNGWEAWIADIDDEAMVPVPGRYTKYILDDSAFLFPGNPGDGKKTNCVFTPHEPLQGSKCNNAIRWPFKYQVTLANTKNNNETKAVTFFVYPTYDITKIHENIRRHVLGLHPLSYQNTDGVPWRTAFGWDNLPDKQHFFNNCPAECTECKKTDYTEQICKVHLNLNEVILKFYQTAISFFENNATNIAVVDIYSEKVSGGKDILIADVEVITQNTILNLKGLIFGEDQWVFHLNFVTLYIYDQQHNPDRKEKRIEAAENRGQKHKSQWKITALNVL